MARKKTQKKTIEELEQALSPEALKLARKARNAIRTAARSRTEISHSPEKDGIDELQQAYFWGPRKR